MSPLPSSHTARAESAFRAVNRSSADRTLSGSAPAVTVPMFGAAGGATASPHATPAPPSAAKTSSGARNQARQVVSTSYGAATGRGIVVARSVPFPSCPAKLPPQQ